MLALIRGAGDIASGIALRLWRCGFGVVMTEIERPTTIRRTVAFSEAIRLGEEKDACVLSADVELFLKMTKGCRHCFAQTGNALPSSLRALPCSYHVMRLI